MQVIDNISYSKIKEYVNTQIENFNTNSNYVNKQLEKYLTVIQNKYFTNNQNKKPSDVLESLSSFVNDEYDLYVTIIDNNNEILVSKINILNDIKNLFVYNNTSLDLSTVLDTLETEAESERESVEYISPSTIINDVEYLYNYCLEKHKDEESLLNMYIKSIYNPDTSLLDKPNLLLNLNLLKQIIDYNIYDIIFDDAYELVDSESINLSNNWWNKILETEKPDIEKHIEIAIKNFNYSFNNKLFDNISKNNNRKFITNKENEINNILYNKKLDIKDYLIEHIVENTDNDSILFLTEDLKDYLPIVYDTSIYDKKSQLNYIGIWDKRKVFIVNTDEIVSLKNLKKSLFNLNFGNRLLLNPTKPLAYMNIIENPYLSKPLLYISYLYKIEIITNKTNFLYIKDELI